MKKKKILLAIVLSTFVFSFYSSFNKINAAEFECGEAMTLSSDTCNCSHQETCTGRYINYHCCGWCNSETGFCDATQPSPNPSPTPRVNIPTVNNDLLDRFNPLKQHSTKADQLSTPGGLISEVLRFAFPIAGIILFIMLIVAGLKMLTGATNSKNMDEGKQIISTAVLGFIILFASYWIAQLLEIIFGIKILGN